jgi:hypothetical protein
MHIKDSSRPKSISKADNDLKDIEVILRWLSERNTLINFDTYPDPQEEDAIKAAKEAKVKRVFGAWSLIGYLRNSIRVAIWRQNRLTLEVLSWVAGCANRTPTTHMDIPR